MVVTCRASVVISSVTCWGRVSVCPSVTAITVCSPVTAVTAPVVSLWIVGAGAWEEGDDDDDDDDDDDEEDEDDDEEEEVVD